MVIDANKEIKETAAIFPVDNCYICGKPSTHFCEKCQGPICDKHQAEYNQFSQIDYDCCTSCGER